MEFHTPWLLHHSKPLKKCIWALRSAAELGSGEFFFRLTLLGSILGPCSAPLGTILGRSGGHLRACWGQFLVRGGRFGTFLLVDVRFSLCDVPCWVCISRFLDAALGPRHCGLHAAQLNQLPKIAQHMPKHTPNKASWGGTSFYGTFFANKLWQCTMATIMSMTTTLTRHADGHDVLSPPAVTEPNGKQCSSRTSDRRFYQVLPWFYYIGVTRFYFDFSRLYCIFHSFC